MTFVLDLHVVRESTMTMSAISRLFYSIVFKYSGDLFIFISCGVSDLSSGHADKCHVRYRYQHAEYIDERHRHRYEVTCFPVKHGFL